MNNPVKAIENAKRVLANKANGLKYSKNKKRDTDDLNVLIDLVNSYDDFISYKYKLDVVDSLLCYIIRNELKYFILKDEPISLQYFINQIKINITYDSQFNFNELCGDLLTHEISLRVENNQDISNIEPYDTEVNNLLTKLKQSMVWKK